MEAKETDGWYQFEMYHDNCGKKVVAAVVKVYVSFEHGWLFECICTKCAGTVYTQVTHQEGYALFQSIKPFKGKVTVH